MSASVARSLVAGTLRSCEHGCDCTERWGHQYRYDAWHHDNARHVAGKRRSGMCAAVTRVVAVIRIDQVWIAVEPVDMRSGMDRLLAKVIEVFGASQPHHAYLFANRRGTRLKVLVCDGFGIWLAVRRLHQGSLHWPRPGDMQMELTAQQAHALVLGLPWQRLGEYESITIL